MSLSDAKNGSWISLFQLEVARAIAAQLVIVVQYLHAQGFVHGDLHRGNILLQPSHEFSQLSTEMLYEEYGEPVLEPVNRLDGEKLPPGVPQHGILPVWLGDASENVTLSDARILLSDFGEAFSPAREKRFSSHTPLSLRPPETRFEPTKPLTFSSEIWTLACTIWDILAQKIIIRRLPHGRGRHDVSTDWGTWPIAPRMAAKMGRASRPASEEWAADRPIPIT